MIENPTWTKSSNSPNIQIALPDGINRTPEIVVIHDDDTPLYGGGADHWLWSMFFSGRHEQDWPATILYRDGDHLHPAWMFGGNPGEPDDGWSHLQISTMDYQVLIRARYMPLLAFVEMNRLARTGNKPA